MCSKEMLRTRCCYAKAAAEDLFSAYAEMSLNRLHKFTLTELAIFKALVMSFGICIGAYCADALKKWRAALMVITLIFSAFFVWKVFFSDDT